jgi:hypothetical protein
VPPALSEKKLREYSAEHLRYEIEMFLAIGQILRSGNIRTQAEKNALLESFAIHLRNLIAFLYSAKKYPSDVVAADFFDKASAWSTLRSPISSSLTKARTRANTEVGHLTTMRVSGTPAHKEWAVAGLTKEISAESR